jgi:hypothetical protein
MGWAEEDKKLCDIELTNGNKFEFKENNGKIKMLMKESNKSEWQEFQFDEYEQREFEKVMGMNMLGRCKNTNCIFSNISSSCSCWRNFIRMGGK